MEYSCKAILDIQTANADGSYPHAADELAIDSPEKLRKTIERLRTEMQAAAADLDFECAAMLRDQARELESLQLALG